MSKTIKYAKNGALIGGMAFLVANLIKQLIRIDEDPNLKFDWEDFLLSGGKGALIGGGAGVIAGSIKDYNNSLEKPLNTSFILNDFIGEMTLDTRDIHYRLLENKAVKITSIINTNYADVIDGSIIRYGSTEENTALKDDFDIDISVPFAPKSFSSTKLMFDELYDFLEDNYEDKDLITIRPQKTSIGLLFNIKGKEFKVDIVPLKRTRNKKESSSGYLIVNKKSLFQEDSYTKTDISTLRSIKLSPVQQKVLVAIKGWKKNYDVPISSHLVKLFILDAYKANQGAIPRDLTKKLLMVLYHIRNEINFKRIVSIENTNNVLTDMKESKKEKIRIACDEVIEEYNYQPNSILHYFTNN